MKYYNKLEQAYHENSYPQMKYQYEDNSDIIELGSKDSFIIKNNNMNGIGKLSWVNVKSALVYGIVAVMLAIIANKTILGLDWIVLLDVGIMAVLTSFVKNLLTTNEGNFAGITKVVDEPDSK